MLFNCDAVQGGPLLILANKMDLPAALPAHEIATHLDLVALQNSSFHIAACSALRNQGIQVCRLTDCSQLLNVSIFPCVIFGNALSLAAVPTMV